MASEKENQCNCIAVKHFTVRINRFRQYSWLCDGHAQKTEFSCWIHGCRLYSGHVCVHRNVPIIQKKQYFRIWDISVKETRWIKLLGWKRGIRCWRNVRLRFGGFSLNADFMNARIISAADVVQYFFLQFHISGFFLSLCMADSPEHSQSVYIYSLAHCIFYDSADCFRPNASHLPSISSMTNSLFW